jgi:fibronectin-binding autotransporter adhesin
MIGIKIGRLPLRGGCAAIYLAAMAFMAILSSPARVYAQTNGTWTSGTGAWSSTARWSGGIVAGGTNATATFTTSGGTATLTSNIVLGNYTTLAVGTSPRTRINATTAEEIQFATTTGTAPTVTAAGRAEIAAVITGTQGYTKAGTGDLYIWAPNTYTGVTTISAGRVRLQSSTSGSGLGAAGAGNGTVVQSAGTLMLDGAVTVGAEPLMISGTGNADQGSLRQQSGNGTFAGSITATGSASITANTGATLTLSGFINPNSNYLLLGDGGNYLISGGFIGASGTVNFGGTGAITISGSSSFTGTTSVGNTTGLVTMTGYMAGLMDFSPGGARTLAGTGTFSGGLDMGQNASLAPGASNASTDYGTLTASKVNLINGVVTLGILDATTYDRLVMTAGSGGLTLAGASKPQLSLDFSNVLADLPSGTWNLLSFNGLAGNWQSVASTGFYTGTWTGSSGVYTLANVGTSGNQTLTFTQSTGVLAVVPEPSTIVLLGGTVVVAGLTCLRRRVPRRNLARSTSFKVLSNLQ